MKKLLLILAIMALFAGIILLTKPESDKPIEEQTQQNQSQEVETVAQQGEEKTLPGVTEEQCNEKENAFQLKQTAERKLAEELLALNQDASDAEKEQLLQYAEAGLGDNRMARHVPIESSEKKHRLNAFEKLFRSNENSEKVMEDIFMLSLAGEHEQLLDKYNNNKLAPLDPSDPAHKEILASILVSTGGDNGLEIYNNLYNAKQSIPQSLASAMLAQETSKDNMSGIIARIDTNNKGENLGFMGTNSSPLHATLQTGNYLAAEMLLDSANHQAMISELKLYGNEFNNMPANIANKLLDKGYQATGAQQAGQISDRIKATSPQIAARFEAMTERMKLVDKELFEQAPQEIQELINNFKAEQEIQNEERLACTKLKAESVVAIPLYQPIDEEKIKAEIIAMQAAGSSNKNIVISLSAQNKETVEFAYNFFTQQTNKHKAFNNFNQLPQQVRSLIGLMHQEDWQGVIKSLKENEFDPEWGISGLTFAGEFKDRGAPDHVIKELVELSKDKQISRKELQQLQHNTKNAITLLDYGVDFNQKDENNKNLLYYLSQRGNREPIEQIMGYGIHFQPDPYGYDSLDALLRERRVKTDMLELLTSLSFPITENHLDYSKYLKQHYPERYQKVLEAMPALEVEGLWRENSDQNVN